MTRTSSERRPKSPAASRIAHRTQTPDPPPWNKSIRTREPVRRVGVPTHNTTTTIKAHRSSDQSNINHETPDRSAYYSLIATPAATLAVNAPPATEPQIELMSQLQDVVVRLSHSAVGEKQRLAHMQQRIDAYAVLVREQDRMIDELRGMNTKLQKERDTLIAFRQQSLNHDFQVMSVIENDTGVDEEIRRAYAHHEGGQSNQVKSYSNNSSNILMSISPRTRNFVRSLVAQLRDERRKRLEVEEQSSRMIGEQQLTIQRLEDRLRPQTSRGGGSTFFARLDASPATDHRSQPREHHEMDDDDSYPFTPDRAPNEQTTTAHADHTISSATKKTASMGAEVPLAVHGNTYEDATAILFDIRKRHGF